MLATTAQRRLRRVQPDIWLTTAILLAAAFFRLYRLHDIPPGLTHDEAGHGHDAAAVLRDVTPIYFTVGYGREPLFDYVNAGLMALLGPWAFTLRVAAGYWGLLAVTTGYRFARSAFGFPTAAITAALLAVSFWPVATGRQALRSDMLPVWTALAAWAFLQLSRRGRRRAIALGTMASAVGASLYTYIPARALWLAFPLTLAVLAVGNRRAARARWRPALLALAVGLGLSIPLFSYLRANPGAEQRLEMLDRPLDALRAGDPGPALDNARDTLLAFFSPGHGDDFLAYTIPGRPLFDPLTFALLLAGLLTCLKNWRKPAHALCLTWLAIGIAPSLMTGPAALTTRIIGAQPVIYVLPATGLTALARAASRVSKGPHMARLRALVSWWSRYLLAAAAIVLTVSTGTVSARDYFIRWANDPSVRAAYMSTLVAEVQALAAEPTPHVLVSSPLPGVAHDPYIAELYPTVAQRDLHWSDARTALILPDVDAALLLLLGSTPPHAAFGLDLGKARTVALRPGDLDPTFRIASVAPRALARQLRGGVSPPDGASVFGGAVELLGARWLAQLYRPGEVAELLTLWRVLDPQRAGPAAPPGGKSEAALFPHVLNADGSILTQRDALDAPSWGWEAGDMIAQVHLLPLPLDTASGSYAAEVGVYDRQSGVRLVSESGADVAEVAPLQIAAP